MDVEVIGAPIASEWIARFRGATVVRVIGETVGVILPATGLPTVAVEFPQVLPEPLPRRSRWARTRTAIAALLFRRGRTP